MGTADSSRVFALDFDGTMIDSSNVKREAFQMLFEDMGENFVRKVGEFHEAHPGLTRYEKIRIFRGWAGREPDEEEERLLASRFSQTVLKKLCEAPLVSGVEEFLQRPFRVYIVSLADKDEIVAVLRHKKLLDWVIDVYGNTWNKPDAIRDIAARQGVVPGVVTYVGDALEDARAAESAGARFIGLMSVSSNFEGLGKPVVRDFVKLLDIVE